MFLTVCYITKNESRNLAESLSSVRAIADQILVVDTGSTDDTAAVARRFGADVLSFPWCDDFSAARNFALDHVPTVADPDHWLLFLDADESFFAPAGFRAWLETLSAKQPSIEGVLMTRVEVDADAEDLEIERSPMLRLWRHRPIYRYHSTIHEVLVDTRTGLAPAPCVVDRHFLLRHTGYSSARVRDKLLRDYAMLQEQVRQHGEQPLTARYLADACYGLGRYEEAADYARRALAANVATVAGDRGLYGVLLRSLRALGRPLEEQQAVVDEALAHLAGTARAEFVGWQGRLRLAAGDAAGAHEDLAECLTALADASAASADGGAGQVGSSGAAADLPDLYAADAQALFALGQKEAAEKQAMAALASNPYQEEALTVLAKCLPDGAAFLSRVLPLYPAPEKGASFLATFAERQMLPSLRVAAARHLSSEERESRARVTELFAQAQAGDLAKLMQGLPLLAGQAVQQLFAALVLLPESRRHAQPARAAEWQAVLPAPMRRLLDVFHAMQDAGEAGDGSVPQLAPGDEGTFFTGLDSLDGFATEAQLLPYARLAEAFGPAALLRTAQWLYDREMAAAAFDLLQRIPADFLSERVQAASFWYLTGRALYALGADGAAECFDRAEAAGCTARQIAFYRQGITASTSSEEVRA